tara:strand:+ start:1390 stop:1770 length:381 start_codon:yes stop_codon:yes gene_type:complete
MPYRDRASFNRSQFLSLTVLPPLTPKTLVCTAPLMPETQTSLLLTTTEGDEAVEGALSITVLPVVFEEVVLLDVVFDTVFDEELTVFEEELTVLLTVVFVTVSVEDAGNVQTERIANASKLRLNIR